MVNKSHLEIWELGEIPRSTDKCSGHRIHIAKPSPFHLGGRRLHVCIRIACSFRLHRNSPKRVFNLKGRDTNLSREMLPFSECSDANLGRP
jgi:hypothetical protein